MRYFTTQKQRIWLSVAISLIVTLILRFTLYVEDCNLLVLVFTFLFFFALFYFAAYLLNRLINH